MWVPSVVDMGTWRGQREGGQGGARVHGCNCTGATARVQLHGCNCTGALTFRVQNSDQRVQSIEEELQEQLCLHDAEHP
jgi:hypothetical protein